MRSHRFHSARHEHGHGPRIGFGLFVILVGVLALLNNVGLFDVTGMLHFWPVTFVVAGVLLLSRGGDVRRRVLGTGLLVLGGLLVLRDAGYLSFDPHDLWPLALIFAGCMSIARAISPRRGWHARYERDGYSGMTVPETGQEGRFSATVVMSASRQSCDAGDFAGGEVSVLMGGMELDLRQAVPGQDAVLQVDILLGGLEIRLPPGWAVQVETTALMGAVDVKVRPEPDAAQRLILRGSVVLGGVEVRY